MTTPARRPGSESAATPTPFSYAQAAKGISSNTAPPTPTSKPASGTATPSKEANALPVNTTAPAEMSWADDAESQSGPPEVQTNGANPSSKQSISQQLAAVPNISSPELGASSASTATKDDDVLSVQNQSSESTWENKSQTSNSVDKAPDHGDVPSAKAIKKEVEKSALKPLQEAPLPPVNFWKQRADELKAKAAQKVNAPKPVAIVSNGVPQGPNGTSRKKTRAFGTSDDVDVKGKPLGNDGINRSRDEEKANRSRKEDRLDPEVDRSKKSAKSRLDDRDGKFNSNMIPLLPDRDQESWPTPDSAIDEDRRKANERDEKTDKEKNQSSKPVRKPEWKTVPITPSVVFNTPLPNTSSGRRGGRGGGRGGAQGGGRAGSYAANLEKDSSNATGLSNGDHPRRGRAEAPQARDSSPSNARRAASVGSTTLKDSKPLSNGGEKASKGAVGSEGESSSRKSADMTSGQQGAGQNNTFLRQYPGRPNKNKRGDFSAPSERRKDGDVASPKEHTASFDRRTSSAAVPDAVEEGERRAPAFHDGQTSQPKQGNNDRRQFPSFSNRERGRGASRGGARGGHGFQNGHNQFANGPVPPLHSSSTFPLPRSPTTLHAEHPPYFPSVPPHNRPFRGNGPRSQSLTTDNLYSRGPNGYSAGPPSIAPIQPYVGNVYEYSMMPPMSAVPFGPYVNFSTLQNMVSTQLEYYFSVENLCKDIFLRRHMDSKGFVFLSVIADFNRIKQLTTDLELIKLVCYQSRVIEWLVGPDGKDRLRRQEGWEQWVLNISERDPSAQNDGPEELLHPPVPHVLFPEGQFGHAYPEGPAGSPTGPISPTNDGSYQSLNGAHAGPHPAPSGSVHAVHNGVAKHDVPNGITQHNHSNRISSHTAAVPEFKPANAEADSFSNEQVETLNVLVRKHDQAQQPHGMPNGSIGVNGTGPSQGNDGGKIQDSSIRPLTPFPSGSYWVKGQDAPVESPPLGSSYEFYAHLRSKALEQRQYAPTGNCPYDMNVLYQFWSHFLIRNFNTHMYDEFRHFAFEDAAEKMSDVGLNNLITYYGASLSSSYIIRERVARHYVELVNSENPEAEKPAFKQLRSAWRNGALNLRSRKRISEFINDELRAALEQ